MIFSQKRIKQLTNIAIYLLKSHKPEAIYSLKDFFTIIPIPEKTNQIFITAIYQLMETEPATIYWLLKNPSYLQPEIDISLIVTQKFNQIFIDWGFKPEDIHFNHQGYLEFNQTSKDKLLLMKDSCEQNGFLTIIQFYLTGLLP